MSEENNLDDFFAKKDKVKKKTTKSSRITPDDIGQLMEKKLAKSAKKGIKSKPKEGSDNESQVLNVKVEGDDGEWKEYEQEAEKDYSNLKIQSLNISSKTGAEQESNGNNQSGDEEGGEKKDVPQGPWKPISAPASVPDPEIEQPIVLTQSQDETPKTGKYVPPGARQSSQSASAPAAVAAATADKPTNKYIPPAMRQKMAGSSSSGPLQAVKLASASKAKKVAPNVSSVEDFPSLGAVKIIEQGATIAHDFERVKGGGRQIENPLGASSKISLDNKFGALEERDS